MKAIEPALRSSEEAFELGFRRGDVGKGCMDAFGRPRDVHVLGYLLKKLANKRVQVVTGMAAACLTQRRCTPSWRGRSLVHRKSGGANEPLRRIEGMTRATFHSVVLSLPSYLPHKRGPDTTQRL